MGGFTRPRDLRAGNWFPGGPYIQRGKVYESPHGAAYQPHTVFLLETRYKVRHGIGRVDAKDHVVGVCRAGDFIKLVRKYNSRRCPADAKESMDNACWPWLPKGGKVLKPTRWWGPDEKLEDIMKEIYEVESYSSQDVERVLKDASNDADEIDGGTSQGLPPLAKPAFNVDKIRSTYISQLQTEPFWLPLLAITYSTRPLALTMARLSKGRERGLPFYAVMSNDDRKCLFSYGNRMSSMRLDRMRKITLDIVSRLAGYMGGFVGIRFSTQERGRGICGEGLADPIPANKRVVRVQVGNWLYRSQDEAALYREGAEQWGGKDAVDVAMMSEWGRRLDADGNEIPLTEQETATDELQEIEVDEEEEEEEEEKEGRQQGQDIEDEEALLRDPSLQGRSKKWRLKPALARNDEAAAALRRKLAYRLSGSNRSVIRV